MGTSSLFVSKALLKPSVSYNTRKYICLQLQIVELLLANLGIVLGDQFYYSKTDNSYLKALISI